MTAGSDSRQQGAGAGVAEPPAYREPQPLYKAIKAYVVDHIDSGAWAPGARIPSESEIAVTMGASRMTVNRAIRELTAEGRVNRVQGLGSFVARPRPPATLLNIRSIGDEIAERGGVHSCEVITQEAVSASETIAGALEIAPGSTVFHVMLVHRENDRPVQIEDRHVNPALAPAFLAQDFATATPSRYLLGFLPVTEIEHRIESRPLDARECALLQVPAQASGLILNRRSWSGRPVVTTVRLVNPGAIYSVGGRFRVDGIHQG